MYEQQKCCNSFCIEKNYGLTTQGRTSSWNLPNFTFFKKSDEGKYPSLKLLPVPPSCLSWTVQEPDLSTQYALSTLGHSPKQSGSLWYVSPSKKPRALHVAKSSQFIMYKSINFSLKWKRESYGENRSTIKLCRCQAGQLCRSLVALGFLEKAKVSDLLT